MRCASTHAEPTVYKGAQPSHGAEGGADGPQFVPLAHITVCCTLAVAYRVGGFVRP